MRSANYGVAAMLALCVAMCCASGALAQSRRVMQHPLTDMAEAHRDVVTSHHFVNAEHNERLPLGEPITVLCSFYNGATTPLNVSMVMGSLNSPFVYEHFLKNFTPRGINTTVGPDQEVTFQYRLIVDAQQLDTVDYRLVLTVFYDDDNEQFTSTFFNDTRKFFYPDTPTDTRQLAMYAVGALAAALVAMIVMRGSGSGSSSKGSSRGAGGADDSFAGDRGHMPAKASSSRRRRTTSSD